MAQRPPITRDNGHAHIAFGADPRPVLLRYGYCVVEGVFDQTFCTGTIDEMWRWLRQLGTGIRRDDVTTWSDAHWPLHIRSGLVQHTLGHEEFMWRVREHANVRRVFAAVYGTEQLLTSFDGASIVRPISSGYTKASNDSWLHTDQDVVGADVSDVYASDHYSVQGVANFADVGDNDGSLFIGVATHTLHTELFAWNQQQPKNNWYLLNAADIQFLLDKRIEFVKVNAPAGALLLFDSRCFHSGSSGLNDNNTTFRYVVYVSQTPAMRATKEDLALKRQAIATGNTTNHWSSCNIRLFDLPRRARKQPPAYYTRKQNVPKYAGWSADRQRLAGLVAYR